MILTKNICLIDATKYFGASPLCFGWFVITPDVLRRATDIKSVPDY